MPHLYDTFAAELEVLRQKQQLRTLGTLTKRADVYADFNGRRYLNLSSNDYLGLGGNPQLVTEFLASGADVAVLDYFGLTSSSSRLLTGNHASYDALEADLAALYQTEAACVFNSGYHANLGLLSALAERPDLILSDKLNHASIMDGMRLAEAKFLRYQHLDYTHLEELLRQHRDTARRIFIVTESVFSMDGDVADLRTLVALKERYGAFLIVDEAHALGVFGQQGRGVCEAQGVPTANIDILLAPCGKAVASLGAYAMMPKLIKDYLINKMRPLIFTTALPPVILNWDRFILRKMIGMEAERTALQLLAQRLRAALTAHGLQTGGASQIMPIIIGENDAAVNLATFLREQGFLIFAIRPPTVPPHTARLRLSLNAALSWEQIAPLPALIGAYYREAALAPTAP